MKSFRPTWLPIHRPIPGLPWRIAAVVIGLGLMALWGTGPLRASSLRPALLEPADGAMITGVDAPPLGVPTLRWSPVPGATRYQVQISQSQGFANPLVETTYATTLTPAKAWVDGIYYWRVRAEVDRTWQEFSDWRTFHKDWSAGGTNKPILLSPAQDQVLSGFSADHFRWEPVLGAARYRFEISGSPSFSTVDYTAHTLAPQHTPTQRMQNRQYYWRVTPLDKDDHPGAPSDVWGFQIHWSAAPQPLAPENDAVLRFVPRFSWTAVEGAQSYVLEISTEYDFASYTSYTTLNTDFTPTKALANNEDYYWRVKAIVRSGRAAIASPPSEPRRFITAWNQPPQLLTPANNGIERSYPFFSWSPVPGAEYYRIQIDDDIGFGSPLANEKLHNATAYTQPSWREVYFDRDIFWRVQAIDAAGNTTDWTVPFMFRLSPMPPPNLVYPLPYYVPDADMPVHTERTIAWPVFVWDTTHGYLGGNGPAAFVMPDYYRLSVSSQPDFSIINFTIETAGQAAAPTSAHPFHNLQDGQTYYWRVEAMKSGNPLSLTTIVWQTRIDRSKPQLPFADTATPIHPADGFEAVAAAPVLGWLPVTDATHYEVQVSRGPDFREDALVDHVDAFFPYYVPGQGKRTPLAFGTYWWRVRAKDQGGNVLGGWSAPRHFNLSLDLMTGNPIDYAVPTAPSTLLGVGPLYDAALSFVASSHPDPPSPYDLGNLHVIQDRSHDSNYYWSLAFGVNSGISEPVSYGIYFDIDHGVDQGAPTGPRGNAIPHARYRPEYAVYVDRSGDSVQAFLYTWNGAGWSHAVPLFEIGGKVWYDPATAAVQVLVPYTTLVNEWNAFVGSLAVTVFSLDAGGSVQDTIPAQQGGTFDNPAFVSDMPMPLYPFDTPLDNPFVFREMPALRWRMPTFDSIDGYQVEIARDADFTTVVQSWETYESSTSSLYAVAPAAFHPDKAYNDEESYYWRVRVRHERYDKNKSAWYDYGPWSLPMRFKLTSYPVGQPRIAFGDPVATTPTFLWERVEGAAGYTLQVSTSSDMKTLLINEGVDGNSYTPATTLADGTYYWRVAMRRAKNVYGQWTPVYSFTKRSLVPQPLGPIDGAVVNQQPTFSWAPVIANSPDVNGLRLAAPTYRLQWANNPEFTGATSVDTTATAYTLVERRSLSDGPWYWRVAMLDGDGKPGDFSAPQGFYKEYLKPELIAPVQGTTPTSPQFEWLPIPGAAYYRVELANNPAFSRSKTTVTPHTRFTPQDKLDAAEYYWRVQMVDQDGKVGPLIDGRFATTPAPELGPSVFLPLVHRD